MRSSYGQGLFRKLEATASDAMAEAGELGRDSEHVQWAAISGTRGVNPLSQPWVKLLSILVGLVVVLVDGSELSGLSCVLHGAIGRSMVALIGLIG